MMSSPPVENIIKQFLQDFPNPDDPMILTRQELEEYLEYFVMRYEKEKHKKKVKQYPIK